MSSSYILGGSLAELLRFAGVQHAGLVQSACLRERAEARNVVFFNTKGRSEPGKSSSAERRFPDGLASCSDHARIVLPL